MNQIICRAIGERRLLELHYHGYPRIVEPHVYGKDHQCPVEGGLPDTTTIRSFVSSSAPYSIPHCK